jgi:site-specific recombinase XerC
MSDELDRIQNKIQRQEDKLPTDWILQDYHSHLKRTGAEARGTQANYLKALRKILVKEDIDLGKLQNYTEEELQELNREIADRIQNSEYRSTEGSDGKRRKREYWSAWKKLLETQGISTKKTEGYIPEIKFTEEKNAGHEDTRPEDLPTREQMKKFVKALGERSRGHVALRNQALALLLWDKGPRIGEALGLDQCRGIRLKDVSVKGSQVKIRIPGNKKSDTRKVEIFQGRKTLKDWIQKHPYRDNRDARLFPVIQKDSPQKALTPNSHLSTKFHSCAQDLDFKTSGEPFHVFRKAMVTFHIVNEYGTWEQICKWHGKKTDATKPDYLKMALSDVDASVAASMGVSDDVDRERDNRMLGAPLLPLECSSCGRSNRCYREICDSCGTELPEADLPDNLEHDEEKVELEKMRAELETVLEMAEKFDVDIDL